MAATIITPDDLQSFKQELLSEIQKLLSQRQTAPARKWLKSNEVRRLLLLSPGTLQNLRVNGTLPFTKIGGVIFYCPAFQGAKTLRLWRHPENDRGEQTQSASNP